MRKYVDDDKSGDESDEKTQEFQRRRSSSSSRIPFGTFRTGKSSAINFIRRYDASRGRKSEPIQVFSQLEIFMSYDAYLVARRVPQCSSSSCSSRGRRNVCWSGGYEVHDLHSKKKPITNVPRFVGPSFRCVGLSVRSSFARVEQDQTRFTAGNHLSLSLPVHFLSFHQIHMRLTASDQSLHEGTDSFWSSLHRQCAKSLLRLDLIHFTDRMYSPYNLFAFQALQQLSISPNHLR